MVVGFLSELTCIQQELVSRLLTFVIFPYYLACCKITSTVSPGNDFVIFYFFIDQ